MLGEVLQLRPKAWLDESSEVKTLSMLAFDA